MLLFRFVSNFDAGCGNQSIEQFCFVRCCNDTRRSTTPCRSHGFVTAAEVGLIRGNSASYSLRREICWTRKGLFGSLAQILPVFAHGVNQGGLQLNTWWITLNNTRDNTKRHKKIVIQAARSGTRERVKAVAFISKSREGGVITFGGRWFEGFNRRLDGNHANYTPAFGCVELLAVSILLLWRSTISCCRGEKHKSSR